MVKIKEQIVNIPNTVSLIRILMAPVLLFFALSQQPVWYLGALGFTVFTDVLDGFLARALSQITEMGSHLDSWGDFVIYNTMAICGWLLWPEILKQEMLYFVLILLSFLLPAVVGYIKFGVFTSYHTWAVKLAVAFTIVAYFLLFTGLLEWPFRIAAVLCLVAAVEELAITLLIQREHVDVRTVWQAMKYRNNIR